ncbi:hypothetical protein M514_06127 [Trichuris suis]|nr:hypothetical protein M514_06127 [Trichuris suis]
MDSAGSPWLLLLLLWPSLGVEVMLEEDVLLCNASSSTGDVRKFRLEGYLFPNDLVRSMANSIKFDFVPSDSLWSPEVNSFCDVMELSSSKVTGGPQVSVQPVAYLSGHVLLTFLPFETGHVAEGEELRCFSEELWMRHVHSVGQLGLVIIYPKGSDQPVNVTNLFLTIKGVRFPFLFVPFMRWSTEVIDTAKILQDLFNDFSNVSCTLAAKGDGDGKALDSLLNSFSRTSVLFVSVSFIILMVISLAWLVFYYVQRFRYAHAKDRLAHRLFNAARKTLSKLPVKTVHSTNGEPMGDCPVCIEPFHNGDVVRTLLCKCCSRHAFHKTCVDPWLLQHRTCPLCKLDILKAIGYTFKVSEESVRDDVGSALGRSIEAAVTGLRHPLASGSDFHDSFFPTPTPSPPPVQQVLRPQDTHCYTIIPMTVHSSSSSRAKRQKDVTVSGEAESHNTCHPNVQITVTNFDSPSSDDSRDQSEQMQISRVTAEPAKGNAVSTYFQISVTPFGIGLSGKRRNRSSDCRQPGSLEKGSSRTAAKQVAAKRVQA